MARSTSEQRFQSAKEAANICLYLGIPVYGWHNPKVLMEQIKDQALVDTALKSFDSWLRSYPPRAKAERIRSYIANKAYWIKKSWQNVLPEHRVHLRPVLRRFFTELQQRLRYAHGDPFMEL